jgi:hypothetical protein
MYKDSGGSFGRSMCVVFVKVHTPGAFLFNTNVMRKKSPQLPKIYHDHAVISTHHQEVASCSLNSVLLFLGM